MLARLLQQTHSNHRMHNEMDRVFADVFGFNTGLQDGAIGPAMNIWEDDNAIFVEAEVPGMAMQDLEVTVAGKEVTLKGERKWASDDKAIFHRRERQYGAFERTLRFAVELDAENVKAGLVDGVLTITLPKAPASKPRRIEVRTSK